MEKENKEREHKNGYKRWKVQFVTILTTKIIITNINI